MDIVLKFHPSQFYDLDIIDNLISFLNKNESFFIQRFDQNKKIIEEIISNQNIIVSTRSSLLIEASLLNIKTYSDFYYWNTKSKSSFWLFFSPEVIENINFIEF
jgi:uncharacterized protein YjgD (DUF1641 family)